METWVEGVQRLEGFVRDFIQVACYRLTISLQQVWQFFQLVTTRFIPVCAPMDAALRENFLPDLMGGSRGEVTYSLQKHTPGGMNWEGIGIPEPTQDATASFDMLKHFYEVRITSLINEEVLDLRAHDN